MNTSRIFVIILIISFLLLASFFIAGCSPRSTPTPSPTHPAHHADLMIFAAHPDDETFCCGTLIQQALGEGKSVHIVLFTNGDGSPDSASLVTGKPIDSLGPDDYIDLARIRQNETLGSVATLGLDSSAVTFLGYPDGGLEKIYNNPGEVYTQPYTLKNSTYGLRVPDYHTQAYGTPASYLRENVLMDVTDLLQEWNSDQVYVHCEAEVHPDHRAVFRFVRDVLHSLGSKSRVYTFCVNYLGGAAKTCPTGLDCSAAMQLSPTDEQAGTKYKPVLMYQSQIKPLLANIPALKARGLSNFSLQPEPFWPIDLP